MKALRIVNATFGAIVSIAIFVVLPWLALLYLPVDVLRMLGPIQDMVMVLNAMGLVLAVFYAAKALTRKRNPVNLVASVGLELAGFYLFLFFIGLGDPTRLGIVEMAIPMGQTGPAITLTLDLRIFVLAVAMVLAIKVVLSLMGFFSARRQPA